MNDTAALARLLVWAAAGWTAVCTVIPQWNSNTRGTQRSAWSNFDLAPWVLVVICVAVAVVASREAWQPWAAGQAVMVLGVFATVVVVNMLVKLVQGNGAGWAPLAALFGTLLISGGGSVMASDSPGSGG